jgi:hypothetical protein
MVTANWFVTATEARNNVVKDIAVHGEISSLEMEILLAVQRGDYQVTVAGASPWTQPPAEINQVFTVDPATNILQVLQHGFTQAQTVLVSSTQQLPAPLMPFTYYYVIYVDENHIKLATSRINAQNNIPIAINISLGVGQINLTDAGSAYVTAPQVTISGGNPITDAQAIAHLSTRGRLESVTVLDGGTGFNYTPAVEVVTAGSGAQAGAVRMQVVGVTSISFGGSGYNVGDTIILITGNGLPPASFRVLAVNGGSATQVVIQNSGSYLSTQLPNITDSDTFSAGTGSGCLLNLSMGVVSVAVQNGGLSYAQPPLVTVTGGGGVNCQLQAVLTGGVVTSFTVVSPGSGFTFTPSIAISSGLGATVVPQLTPTTVAEIILLDNGGATYTQAPEVQISTPGAGASVNQVFMRCVNVTVRALGQDYQLGDQIYVSGGQGARNTVLQVSQLSAAGGIQQVQIVDGGSYYVMPALQSNPVYGGSGINASVDLVMGVDNITLSSGGSGYQIPPVVIVSGAATRSAQAQVILAGDTVAQVTVTDPGTGYLTVPSVTLTCGSGAQAVARLTGTGVDEINVSSAGSGYVTAPLVQLVGGGGSGAQAEAILVGDQVNQILVTNAGTGYTSAPDVIVQGNAQAQATLIPTTLAAVDLTNAGSNYVTNPNVILMGNGSAQAVLSTTSVSHVTVLNRGANFSSDPLLLWSVPQDQTGSPRLPVVRTQRSFALSEIVVTDAGDNYQSVPVVTLSAPLSTGTQATAIAVLSVGQGVFRVQAYTASQDYWKVNCGLAPSSDLLVRPYKDQIASVKKYFTDLGYSILLETNPATGVTLQWTIRW